MSSTVRIGLLGASRIAPPAVIAPAREVDRVAVSAVAARDLDRAVAYAAEHGIEIALGSYDELIADDRIDAIYNGLPASEHAPWTIAALRAGKHVLCEKPFCLSADEARSMVAAADESGRVLVEAFHWRYHPLAARLRELLDGGRIGTITGFEGTFSVPIPPGDIRHDLALGGGAFMDLGCYPLHMARFVFDSEPHVMSATTVEGAPGIDLSLAAQLSFDGVPASVSCDMSLGTTFTMWIRITGTEGDIHVLNPIHPSHGNRITITGADGSVSEESVPGRATYHYQLEAFVAAVLDGASVPTGGADAIATMEAMDAIYAAAGLPPRGA